MVAALRYWKLGLHLLLGTKRFGVNNTWWGGYDSIFSRPLFGFGIRVLARPWRWRGVMRVVRLRMEIGGLL